jgi:hypothetical protein
MPIFSTLYDLAHRLLTAPPQSALGQLSLHSGMDAEEAHRVLRAAILQSTIPGEDAGTRWGVVRIFMRNLVNRAFAPMKGEAMLQLLSEVEAQVPAATRDERIGLLMNRVRATSRPLAESLEALVQKRPVAEMDYITWLQQRVAFYAGQPVEQLDPQRIIEDVRVIATQPATRIPNMGTALAANLLGDLGARALVKPDKHILLTMSALVPEGRLSPEDCICTVIQMARQEAPGLRQDERFAWMPHGLHPRHLDRLVYLIGSDNFHLDGRQKRRWAPHRRQLMLAALQGRPGDAEAVLARPPAPRTPPRGGAAARGDARIVRDNAGTDAEAMFYDALGGDESAVAFVDGLISLAQESGCQVHYTFTNNADLRIRAFRQGAGRKEQNIATITWRTRDRVFAGALLASPEVCRGLGLDQAQARHAGNPLPTSAGVAPADEAHAHAFGLAVQRSIDQYRGDA